MISGNVSRERELTQIADRLSDSSVRHELIRFTLPYDLTRMPGHPLTAIHLGITAEGLVVGIRHNLGEDIGLTSRRKFSASVIDLNTPPSRIIAERINAQFAFVDVGYNWRVRQNEKGRPEITEDVLTFPGPYVNVLQRLAKMPDEEARLAAKRLGWEDDYSLVEFYRKTGDFVWRTTYDPKHAKETVEATLGGKVLYPYHIWSRLLD